MAPDNCSKGKEKNETNNVLIELGKREKTFEKLN